MGSTLAGSGLTCLFPGPFDHLSGKHRAVLELAFVHGMSYDEIAKIVGCPVGTVKSRMSYALKALYAKLRRTDFER